MLRVFVCVCIYTHRYTLSFSRETYRVISRPYNIDCTVSILIAILGLKESDRSKTTKKGSPDVEQKKNLSRIVTQHYL